MISNRSGNKIKSNIEDKSHPTGEIFEPLPSGQRFRSLGGSTRYTNSFYSSTIGFYNTIFST